MEKESLPSCSELHFCLPKNSDSSKNRLVRSGHASVPFIFTLLGYLAPSQVGSSPSLLFITNFFALPQQCFPGWLCMGTSLLQGFVFCISVMNVEILECQGNHLSFFWFINFQWTWPPPGVNCNHLAEGLEPKPGGLVQCTTKGQSLSLICPHEGLSAHTCPVSRVDRCRSM